MDRQQGIAAVLAKLQKAREDLKRVFSEETPGKHNTNMSALNSSTAERTPLGGLKDRFFQKVTPKKVARFLPSITLNPLDSRQPKKSLPVYSEEDIGVPSNYQTLLIKTNHDDDYTTGDAQVEKAKAFCWRESLDGIEEKDKQLAEKRRHEEMLKRGSLDTPEFGHSPQKGCHYQLFSLTDSEKGTPDSDETEKESRE